jgi:4'-phosphopantetheinyl transferase
VAHSEGLILYAVTHYREIGVDVERIRSIPEAEQIAAHFFSRREYAEFCAVPARLRCEAFFNWWTRKEALVKAWGDGLARPLDQFEVSLSPGQPPQLLSVAGDAAEAGRWSLKTLMPAPAYIAALAVGAVGGRLTRWLDALEDRREGEISVQEG